MSSFHTRSLIEGLRSDLAEAEAERDRLRGVLWQIARDDPEGWAGMKARNALSEGDR